MYVACVRVLSAHPAISLYVHAQTCIEESLSLSIHTSYVHAYPYVCVCMYGLRTTCRGARKFTCNLCVQFAGKKAKHWVGESRAVYVGADAD